MAINIPMPDSPGTSFIQGLDTGSNMLSRMMQPVLERERLKQQQNQFIQNLALQKQEQDRAQALLPYTIQQYKDTHRTAQSEADFKELYRKIIQDAANSDTAAPTGNAPPSAPVLMPPQANVQPNAAPGVITSTNGAPNLPNPVVPTAGVMPQGAGLQEHELRAGNPRLSKLDAIAGLVPGIPKPVQHISNGMIFTTYPSGRMTAQQVQGAQTPGQLNVSAKEASKIRDQATALVNSANLVQQGYDLLDNNPDLTGPGTFMSAIPIPFTGAKLNLSNNPELGKFKTVTGKLQAELGKYAASRGGIQAVKWAGSVKPDASNPQDYNYGMFEEIQNSLKNDYSTLNQQYKAATGEDLPVPLPQIARKERPGKTASSNATEGKKAKKVWKLVNGELVQG